MSKYPFPQGRWSQDRTPCGRCATVTPTRQTRQLLYSTVHTVLYCTVNSIHYSTVLRIKKLQHSTIQYNTVQYSTLQYNTAHYSTIQNNTVQYSTIQYNTVQYSTIQYSTVQHSTTRSSVPPNRPITGGGSCGYVSVSAQVTSDWLNWRLVTGDW